MQQLKEIAATNPRLAVALAMAKPQLPQVRSIKLVFESGAPEQPVSAAFDSQITEDFWVYDISYQVQQPQAFSGSILRGQQVWYNSLNPNILLSLNVSGGVGLNWLFAPSPTPIEQMCRPATGPGGDGRFGCCSNFVMFFPQTVKATAYFTRQYDDTSNGTGEIPTIVTISFAGLTLGCQQYGGLTVEQAQSILRSEYAIDTPAVPPTRQPPARLAHDGAKLEQQLREPDGLTRRRARSTDHRSKLGVV